MNVNEFKKLNKEIIRLLQPETDYEPESIERFYDEKILKGEKGKENLEYLIQLFKNGGSELPNLLIAKCSAGKTYTINVIADQMIIESPRDIYFFLLTPARNQSLQIAYEYNGFEPLVGGRHIIRGVHKLASVYEKIGEIEEYCKELRSEHPDARVYLIIDEMQEVIKARNYRDSIREIQRLMCSDLFNTVLCMTGTPMPVSCFRFDKIIFMTDIKSEGKIKEIDILLAHNCRNALYSLALKSENPYIRVNNLEEIKEMKRFLEKQGCVADILTSQEKKTKIVDGKMGKREIFVNETLNSIIQNGDLKNEENVKKIICSSLLDAGINLTRYSETTIPVFGVLQSFHMNVDDEIQFYSRFRKGLSKALLVQPIPTIVKKGRQIPEFKTLNEHLFTVLQTADRRIEAVTNVYNNIMGKGFEDVKLEDILKRMLIINTYDSEISIDNYYTVEQLDKEGLKIKTEPENLFLVAYKRYNEQFYFHSEKLAAFLQEELQTEVKIFDMEEVSLEVKKEKSIHNIDRSDIYIAISLALAEPDFVMAVKNQTFKSFTVLNYEQDSVRKMLHHPFQVDFRKSVEEDICEMMKLGLDAKECIHCITSFKSQGEYKKIYKKLQLTYFIESIQVHRQISSANFKEHKMVYNAVQSIKKENNTKTIAINEENLLKIQRFVEEKYGKRLSFLKIKNRIKDIYIIYNDTGQTKRNPTITKIKSVHYVAEEIWNKYGPLKER